MKFIQMPHILDKNGETLSTVDIKEGRLRIIA